MKNKLPKKSFKIYRKRWGIGSLFEGGNAAQWDFS